MFGRKMARETHRKQLMSELGESYGHLRRAVGHAAHGTAQRVIPTYDRARYAAKGGWNSAMRTVVPLYHQMREGASARAHQMRAGAGMRAHRMREEVSARALHMREGAGARAIRKQLQHQFEKPFENKKFAKQYERQFGRRPMLMHPPSTAGARLRGLAKLVVAGAAVGAAGAAMARRRRDRQAEWEEYDPMTGETRYHGSGESAYGHRSAKDKVAAGVSSVADTLSDKVGRIADSIQERAQAASGQSGTGGPREPGRPGGPMTGPSGTGPAPAPGGVPGTTANPPGTVLGPGGKPMRGGDPALGFPDEP